MAGVETWLIRGEGCTTAHLPESGIIGAGLLGIKNGSDAEVEIRNVLLELSRGADTAPGLHDILRISALVGGQDLSVTKMDTGNAALPSQVRIAKSPSGVTVSSTLRRLGQLRGIRAFSGTTSVPTAFGGRIGWHLGSVGSWQRQDALTVQPIVLREGEGIAWRQERGFTTHTQHANAIVRNASSGATYRVEAYNLPIGEQDTLLAIFNGSGSGVVLEVMLLESHDVGQQGDGTTAFGEQVLPLPGYRLVLCNDIVGGESVTPIPFDSGNSTLPAGISVLKNPTIIRPEGLRATRMAVESTLGVGYAPLLVDQRNGLVRGFPRNYTEGWAPESTVTPTLMEGAHRDVMRTQGTFPGVILRRNECLVLTHYYRSLVPANNPSGGLSGSEDTLTLANFNVAMEIRVSTGAGTLLANASAIDAIVVS